MGKVEEAINNLKQTIKINPKDIGAYKTLAAIYIDQKEPDKALNELETAILENSDNGDLHYSLAQVFKNMEETEDYIFHLKKALSHSNTLTVSKEQVQLELSKYKINT